MLAKAASVFEAFGRALNLENGLYQNLSGGHGQYTRRRKTHSETVPVANLFPLASQSQPPSALNLPSRIRAPFTRFRGKILAVLFPANTVSSRKSLCAAHPPPMGKRIICQVSRKTPHRFAPYKCRSIPEPPFAAYLIAHGKRIA